MALKRTVYEVPIERQDAHGKPLEFGELTIESIDGEVRLIIVGERRSKYYVISRESWNLIKQV